jgi:3-dehydroquinate synthase
MSAETVTVELGSRSYPVRIGAGMRREALAAAERRLAAGQKCVAITSPGVAAAQSGFAAELARLMPVLATAADGETAKSAAELARVWDFLAANGVARDGAVFALGGGVVGDLAGFAAASYQRGVDFTQLPTTLLAMVDSSVGGKTGINLSAGKNLVGNFHQPTAVFADTDLLATLPPREFAAGMAEVIKHGIIADADLFGLLEQNSPLAWNHPLLPRVIRRCVEIKAAVVAGDERETSAQGGRALLNLGHTFGHAIEATAGYGAYLHGEAVAIGLVMAARLSAELKHCTAAQAEQVEAVLKSHALPTALRAPLKLDPMLAATRRSAAAGSASSCRTASARPAPRTTCPKRPRSAPCSPAAPSADGTRLTQPGGRGFLAHAPTARPAGPALPRLARARRDGGRTHRGYPARQRLGLHPALARRTADRPLGAA